MLSKITLGNYSHQRKVAQTNQYWKDLYKEKKIFLIKFDKTVKVKDDLSSKEKLYILRKCNLNKIVAAHLKINSFKNRFNSLIDQVTGKKLQK